MYFFIPTPRSDLCLPNYKSEMIDAFPLGKTTPMSQCIHICSPYSGVPQDGTCFFAHVLRPLKLPRQDGLGQVFGQEDRQ